MKESQMPEPVSSAQAPEPTASGPATASGAIGDSASAAQDPQQGGGIIDAGAELVQTVVSYVRQETGDVVREKIVLPTQRAGATVGLAVGVALVLVMGVLFVSAGALILLAQWIGWPAALFAVGGVLILASAGIAYARSRSMQP
jgi:hypothetical protein